MTCPPARRGRIVRCPQCGSTDAGEVESQSAYDLTWMQCGGCGHGGFVDSWQIQFDWNVVIDLADGAALPSHVAPPAPDDDQKP